MLFHSFIAIQCTLINNTSALPPFECKVNSAIDNMTFCLFIRSLNSNKAHGWDDISIRMVKMGDESIEYPLKIIFETALKSGIYPDKWKIANVVPVDNKEIKIFKKTIEKYHYYLSVVRYLKIVL